MVWGGDGLCDEVCMTTPKVLLRYQTLHQVSVQQNTTPPTLLINETLKQEDQSRRPCPIVKQQLIL